MLVVSIIVSLFLTCNAQSAEKIGETTKVAAFIVSVLHNFDGYIDISSTEANKKSKEVLLKTFFTHSQNEQIAIIENILVVLSQYEDFAFPNYAINENETVMTVSMRVLWASNLSMLLDNSKVEEFDSKNLFLETLKNHLSNEVLDGRLMLSGKINIQNYRDARNVRLINKLKVAESTENFFEYYFAYHEDYEKKTFILNFTKQLAYDALSLYCSHQKENCYEVAMNSSVIESKD